MRSPNQYSSACRISSANQTKTITGSGLRARTGSESADSVFSIATAATLAASALPSGVAGVAVMTHKVSAKGSPRDTGFEVLIRSYDANSANRSYRGDDKVTHRTGRQFMERATL